MRKRACDGASGDPQISQMGADGEGWRLVVTENEQVLFSAEVAEVSQRSQRSFWLLLAEPVAPRENGAFCRRFACATCRDGYV